MLLQDDLSPASGRSAAQPLAFLGLGCAVLAGAAVTAAVAVTELTAGDLHSWPSPAHTARAIGIAVGALPPTTSSDQTIAEYLATLWVSTGALLAAAVVVGGWAVRWWWRRWGPTPNGHATRTAIRAELSERAARRSARRTRPDMSIADLRACNPGEVGIPQHHASGINLWVPFTNLTGTIAPQQTGKSRQDLVFKAREAPGALLCSTTKPDLVEFAALHRARRRLAGPVIVYDSTGRVQWPAQLRFSPVAGCEDQQEAHRRAFTLVESAALQVESGGSGGAGNDRVFRERAVVVLTAYLVAAALAGMEPADILRWATSDPGEQSSSRRGRFPVDDEPVRLLHHYGRHELAENLQADMRMDPRTASAVWMSVRRVVGAWTNPRLRELCSPHRDDNLDLRRIISRGGSLFLIADQQYAADAIPLLTTLVEWWLRTAQDLALDYPDHRLAPPATAVLDELANGTPVPRLPEVVSDSTGRGVIVHWAAQSLAQLERNFGLIGCREVLDNTTTFTVWGGVKDNRTLEWVSELCGTKTVMREQRQRRGLIEHLIGHASATVSEQIEPVLRPAEIRYLKANRVIMLHRRMRCFIARTDDVMQSQDATQIAEDVRMVREGSVPIDAHGHLTERRSHRSPI